MASTVWSGQLSFGLVSIPVRLTPAARAKKIPLRKVAAPAPAPPRVSIRQEEPEEPEAPAVIEGESARVHFVPVRNQERVPETEVELAYEFEDSRYVPLEKTALAQIAAPTSSEIALSEFVRLEQIGPVYFERS